MAGRKPYRPRILRELGEAERLPIAYQHAQDPSPERELPNPRLSLGVDANRDELLEAGAKPVDHSESAVTGTGQLDRGLDQQSKQRLERKLRAERDPRVDEATETLGGEPAQALKQGYFQEFCAC